MGQTRAVSMKINNVFRAALWMCGAIVSFMAMALGGRELSTELSTFQVLFFRSLIGLVIISILARVYGVNPFKSQRLGLHMARNVAHFAGQFGWFFAIASIPLAEVFAMEFTIPVWAALLSALFLGERLTARRLSALGLGLAGVLLIVKPGSGLMHPAAFAALGAAVAYAASYVLTKRLTLTDTPLVILFYMTVVQLPLGLIGASLNWHAVHAAQLPWLLVVGVTALTAHYCIARAFALADVSVVLPLDFLRLPLAALLGYSLYGESVGVLEVVGGVLIIGANAATLLPTRTRTRKQGESTG